MALLEIHLFVNRSNLPGAGDGLFTRISIPKGTRILEYKGRVTTWKQVVSGKVFNPYVFYINRNHVIDAMPYKKALGRFANDANGLSKIKGISNNSKYVRDGSKIFIEAIRNISAGSEILVAYGKDYWKVIHENSKLEPAR